MRLMLSAFAAAVCLTMASPSLAQTSAQPGLPIADVSAWIASKGGEVSPVQRNGAETYFTVKDGPMTWAIFFYGCEADVCGDLQFGTVFSNPAVTIDKVNDWNRDQRFLKAFYLPGENGADASAAVQYDLLIQPGGVEQLNDPASVWVGLLQQFAAHIGYLAPTPAAAPVQ